MGSKMLTGSMLIIGPILAIKNHTWIFTRRERGCLSINFLSY